MSLDRAQIRERQYHQKVLEIREKRRHHLQDKQGDLTVSTPQAARIVGTTAAKLRRWDEEKLFPPEHSSPEEKTGQRRYNLRELARALIIHELLQEHADLQAVAAFMQKNAQLINDLIEDITSPATTNQEQEQPWKIKKCLAWAEDAYFWRMFVPRALYLSMRLLHEHTPDNDTWLFFPLTPEGIPEAERQIQSLEQLEKMEEVLLGYCSSEHPFFMCIPKNPILDLPKSYKVIPLEWPENTSRPAGVHLILEERRWRRSSRSMQRGAALLLRLLQETQEQWKPYLQKGNDAMTYHAPEFEKALPGHQILNKIADQIIKLGGKDKDSQRQRWHFCCILLSQGNEIRLPLKQRHLVVQGVGGGAPYGINEKSLSPNENSISMLAYHSRQITYRHNIVDEEPDIASHDQEKDIKSAIAVPIEGKERDWRTLHPLGVLYVASKDVDAFSTEDDLLLLRMMGKLISEQVMAYQMHSLLVDEFAEMVSHPGIVDDYFKEFLSDNQFIRHLEESLKQIQPGDDADAPAEGKAQPFHDLAFIAVNLAMHNHRNDVKATEMPMRSLTRELGRRIKRWARGKSGPIAVYYMHNECYYLILRDIPLEQTARSAFDLQARLYKYIKRQAQQQHGFKNTQVAGLQLHLGAVGYTYDRLQELTRTSPGNSMRVRITNLLNDALSGCKDLGENKIAVWQPQDEKFDYYDELANDKHFLLQDEQFIEQVANIVQSKLKDDT